MGFPYTFLFLDPCFVCANCAFSRSFAANTLRNVASMQLQWMPCTLSSSTLSAEASARDRLSTAQSTVLSRMRAASSNTGLQGLSLLSIPYLQHALLIRRCYLDKKQSGLVQWQARMLSGCVTLCSPLPHEAKRICSFNIYLRDGETRMK